MGYKGSVWARVKARRNCEYCVCQLDNMEAKMNTYFHMVTEAVAEGEEAPPMAGRESEEGEAMDVAGRESEGVEAEAE